MKVLNNLNITGITAQASFYSSLAQDCDYITLYNNYDKCTLSIKITFKCSTNVSQWRTFLTNNMKNGNAIDGDISVYNDANNMIGTVSFISSEFSNGNIGNSINNYTDDQLKNIVCECTKQIQLNESTFTRGTEFYIQWDQTWINYSGSRVTSSINKTKGYVTINALPTFSNTTDGIQCFALYSPDNIDYTTDDGFFKSFRISNVPSLVTPNPRRDSICLRYAYSIKRSGSSSYGNWIVFYQTSLNVNNILDRIFEIPEDLNANDNVRLALFLSTNYETNLNEPDWVSGEYFKKVPTTLPAPIIENIDDGNKYADYTYNSGETVKAKVSPNITALNEYLMYYEDVEIEISSDNGQTWSSMRLEQIMTQGPEYKPVLDEDGNPIYDADGNPVFEIGDDGKPIIVTPPQYGYIYLTDIYFEKVGTYKLLSRAKIKSTGAVFNGETVNFTIYHNERVDAVIQYYSGDDTTPKELVNGSKFNYSIYITYLKDNRLSVVNLYHYESVLNADTGLQEFQWVYISDNQMFSTEGEHIIKAEAINATSGDVTTITRSFTISNEMPAPIEVQGVTDFDSAESYTILIKQDPKSNYDIYYVNVENPDNEYRPNLTTETNDSGVWYKFTLGVIGTYTLYINAEHKESGLTRSLTVNNFSVVKGLTSDDFIRFDPTRPPLHSTMMYMIPTTVRNQLYYWINKKVEDDKKQYLSPLLILENITAYGREVSGSNISECQASFTGIVDYVPERPTIVDVSDNATYYSTRNIKFINNASKQDQAEYIFFIDGKQLEDPFNTTFQVSSPGYHYIFIVGWDNVRPFSYLYMSMKFLIKPETDWMLRQPGIIVGAVDKVGEVAITINFSSLHPDVTHKVTILYIDGTKEEYTYPYDIGVVELKVKKNCTVTATSTYNTSGYSESNSETVDTIYDEKPSLEEFHIFGVVNKEIITQSFGSFKINIGPMAWINFPNSVNDNYDVYVNGMPYKDYSELEDDSDTTYGKDAHYPLCIENHDKEIRKYRIEVIAKNAFDENKITYYYNEVIVDTLDRAFPMLYSHTNNVMNRVQIPTSIHEKHEENVNNIHIEMAEDHSQDYIDIPLKPISSRFYCILWDSELIVVMEYTYYDGQKRFSTFMYGINSNALDELGSLRLIFKAKDFQDIPNYNEYIKNNIEPEAKNGEFIIDRDNGHLYFGRTDGTTKVDIVPITKDMEDISATMEAYMVLSEQHIAKVEYLYAIADEMIIYYKNKLDEFLKELREYYDKLINTCNELDKIKTDLEALHENVESFEAEFRNNTEYIAGDLEDTINDMTNDFNELNTNFNNLLEKLKDTFERGAVVKDEVFNLQLEIKKKVTIADFNTWKTNEEAKYNRFINECRNFFGH